MKTRLYLCTLALLTLSLSFGCREDTDTTERETETGPPQTGSGIAFIFGTVTHNSGPAAGVLVEAPEVGLSTVTDELGRYAFPQLPVLEEGAILKFTDPTLFPEYRYFRPKEGTRQQVNVTMIREPASGTIMSAAGGSVNIPSGLSLFIRPGSALVDGQPYNGPINVTLTYEDPTKLEDMLQSAGNFPGIHPSRGRVVLESYGMSRVRLNSSTGAPVTFAENAPAELYMPPANIGENTLRDTVMFWQFNEQAWEFIANDLNASPEGFFIPIFGGGYYNLDLPFTWGTLTGRIVNEAGIPLPGIRYTISLEGGNYLFTFYTEQDGTFEAPFAPFQTQVFSVWDVCDDTDPALSIGIGPYTQENIDLGDVIVASSLTARNASIVRCSNDPIAAEDIVLAVNGRFDQAYLVFSDEGVPTLISSDCNSNGEQWLQVASTDLEQTSQLVRRATTDLSPVAFEICADLDPDEEIIVNLGDSTYFMNAGNFLLADGNGALTQAIRGRYLNDPASEAEPEVAIRLVLPFTGEGSYPFPESRIELTSLIDGIPYAYFCFENCNSNLVINVTDESPDGSTFSGDFSFIASEFSTLNNQSVLVRDSIPVSGSFRINRR